MKEQRGTSKRHRAPFLIYPKEFLAVYPAVAAAEEADEDEDSVVSDDSDDEENE